MVAFRLLGSIFLLGAVAVSGCSGASAPRRQLSTPTESKRFIATVAGGRSANGWTLAAGASPVAARVWAERAVIADLGRRLRREGSDWGCELAAGSFRLGHVGIYSVGDRHALARQALEAGAEGAQVKAFEADFLGMAMPDLREATAAVCPGAYFG